MRSDLGRFCVLALDMTAAQAMLVNNNAQVLDPECGVAVDSSSTTALVVSNNGLINGSVNTRGQWQLANNAHLSGNPLTQHGPYVADPYADVQMQTPPPCTGQSASGKNNITRNLTPGHFCSGWDFQNNATLNLAAGTYYIDSKLSLKNNVVINGTGVTLVATATTRSTSATTPLSI